MKKLIVAILLLSIVLTSCTSDGGEGSTSSSHENDSTTLGDTNGDGVVEGSDGGAHMGDGTSGMMDGGSDTLNNGDSGVGGTIGDIVEEISGGGFETVEEITSADDAVNFIGSNVYSICGDVIPLLTETRRVPKEDLKNVTFNSKLQNSSGISDIIVSESVIGAFPYALIMLRTDGEAMSDMTSVGSDFLSSMSLAAENASAVTLDGDIVIVMGSASQVDTVMNAIIEAAGGVYSEIGSPVKLLG